MQKLSTDSPDRIPLIAVGIAIVLIIIVCIGLVVKDDDDAAPGKPPPTTEPKLVDDGPYQDEVSSTLREAGFEDRDDWDDDWDEIGIVTEVGKNSLKVMTPKDFVFLISEDGDDACYKPIPILDMGSPGDIVGWSNEGDDSIVCDGEFVLLWDAPKEATK